jgi:cellulose synthase/poly-beta-1,6-N-acetylglucosamine synthase-like glycosyltransferase
VSGAVAAVSVGMVRCIITVVALLFGAVWSIVNAYNLFPVARTALTGSFSATGDGRAELPESTEEYPAVDSLVPAYEEGDVVGQAVRSIQAADYPDEQVSVYVLVEPGDDDTRRALTELDAAFTELVVPAAYPGEPNKPRAMNYGFEHTDGDILGIVDAEDIVDSSLFRQAARSLTGAYDFAQGGSTW